MSAFIVPDRHINLLVAFASKQGVTYWDGAGRRNVRGDEQRIAAVLYAANVRSVNNRYMEKTDEDGFVFSWQHWYAKQPETIAILKACDCFDYQACEVDDYSFSSEAWRIIDAIRGYAVRRLPGYEQAEGWAFEDATEAAPA